MTYGVPAAALLTGMLAFFSLLETVVKLTHGIIARRAERNTASLRYEREKQAFREYLPYATDIERAILGYLVSKGQKSFTVTVDGGLANTLVSRGLIRRMVAPGQSVSVLHVPHQVSPAVWEVLESEMKGLVPADFYKRFDRPPWCDPLL